MKNLRETDLFVATPSKKGVKLTAKEAGVTPKSKVISKKDWDYLNTLSDKSFNIAAVWDFGVGVFQK